MKSRPIILCFVRFYLPGHNSGGPVRTIANMVSRLGDDLDFRIVTSDRDVQDDSPYADVAPDAWNPRGKARVYYVSPGKRSVPALAKLIADTPCDLLYLNSFFDPVFTLRPLLARLLGWLPRKPLLIAPRGEFSEGALAIKRWRKTLYARAACAAGLFRDAIWHASTDREADDIRRVLGARDPQLIDVKIAANLTPTMDVSSLEAQTCSSRERNAPLRVIFLSRISPKKNLDFALRVMARVSAPVEFSIIGPVEDSTYWEKCQALIDGLPNHIKVNVVGSVEHSRVHDIMRRHDLVFLPTRGENFGHVIAEALTAGTPALLADTTPWRGLERAGVGWDLPLTNERAFADAIETAAAKDGTDYATWRQRVRCYADEKLSDPAVLVANRELFLQAAVSR